MEEKYRPCAGVMLVNPRGHVFVGQRLDVLNAYWQMPQGGIESGETPQEAALRELEEETSIGRNDIFILHHMESPLSYKLPSELVPKFWGGRYCGQRQWWFLMRFHGQDSSISLHTAHPEFRAWAWKPLSSLPELAIPFKRDVYTRVLEAFAPFIV